MKDTCKNLIYHCTEHHSLHGISTVIAKMIAQQRGQYASKISIQISVMI